MIVTSINAHLSTSKFCFDFSMSEVGTEPLSLFPVKFLPRSETQDKFAKILLLSIVNIFNSISKQLTGISRMTSEKENQALILSNYYLIGL